MTILLRLLNPKLQFVPLGSTGKIHARWNAQANYVDHSKVTMCGRPVKRVPLTAREMDTARLCGNCYSSLRTYGPQVELVSEREVGM